MTQHVEAGAGAQVYPYLLRKLAVTRPNRVWATRSEAERRRSRRTHHVHPDGQWPCPSRRHHRPVQPAGAGLARVDHSRRPFCGEALEEALSEKIAISMDGKGCWRDNVFVERLWRSGKYEGVYLHADGSVAEAQ
jgi:putative transposase